MTERAETRERILLVDDNQDNLQLLARTLRNEGYELHLAESGEQALEQVELVRPSVVLLDIMMPGGIDGFEVCRRLNERPVEDRPAVIFLSALDEVGSKVAGLKLGAVDYIAKPFRVKEVRARVATQVTVHRLRRALLARNEALSHELQVARELIREAADRVAGPLLGDGEAVTRLREAMDRLSTEDGPVLLLGAPGAGQEAVARTIHLQSVRCTRPFLLLDCSVLNNEHAVALLTARQPAVGAAVDPESDPTDDPTALGEAGPKGKLDLAHGGTLYLDQIDQLPEPAQRELTSYLEQAAGQRAAGHTPAPDVRIMASTHRDLGWEAEMDRFHAPLWRLLEPVRLRLPSLADRREDIPVLAQFFLRQHAQRLGRPVERIAPESMRLLSRYPWPGNVRELQSFVERQILLCGDHELHFEPHMLEGVPVGAYQLLEKLDKGGMGEVWRATHRLLARPAAVKLVRADNDHAPEVRRMERRRFEREARVTANLCSPNTVHLYDFGISEADGAYFYVMELLSGMPLDLLVRRFGPLPPERVVYLLIQACRSLAEAHGAGLVHRDIKPANLFLCKLGVDLDMLKVLDFGVVKGDVQGGPTAGNEDDLIVGTPAYIAPETIRGVPPAEARTDIYALGCVAFYLLTGQEVFDGKSMMEVFGQHLKAKPRPPSRVSPFKVPAELDRAVLRCLEKDLARRPESAVMLQELLEAVPFEEPWSQARAARWWKDNLPEILRGERWGRPEVPLMGATTPSVISMDALPPPTAVETSPLGPRVGSLVFNGGEHGPAVLGDGGPTDDNEDHGA